MNTWHKLSVTEATSLLATDVKQGLADKEIAARLARYGQNKLRKGKRVSGSRYFCESFYGHPCPTSGKNYATAYAFGGPSRPASLVAYPTGGMQHRYRNDSTRFRKACIFTTHKALRENTCPIASGDYSTPVSQRWRIAYS